MSSSLDDYLRSCGKSLYDLAKEVGICPTDANGQPLNPSLLSESVDLLFQTVGERPGRNSTADEHSSDRSDENGVTPNRTAALPNRQLIEYALVEHVPLPVVSAYETGSITQTRFEAAIRSAVAKRQSRQSVVTY